MSSEQESTQNVGSVFSLLGKSLELFKKYWPVFLIVNIPSIFFALMAIIPSSEPAINTSASFSGEQALRDFVGLPPEVLGFAIGAVFLTVLIMLAIILYFHVAFIILQTKVARGDSNITSKPIFAEALRLFFPMLGLFILTGIVVLAGAVLLIIPGLIAFVMLVMAPYIMVDQKVGVITAMERSFNLAKKNFWKVAAAAVVLLLITIGAAVIEDVPVIGALIAALITIAFSMVIVLRYFQLKNHSPTETTVAPPPVINE